MEKLTCYAIGDCNTIGADGLNPADTIPFKLCELLRAKGLDVELSNLGQTMNTSREGVTRAENQVRKPNLLLINFGLADAWVTSMPQVYVPYFPDSFLRRLGRRLLKMLKRRMRSKLMRKLVSQGEVVPPDEYRANVTQMIKLARSKNPEVCIILWTTPWARNSTQRNVNIARYNGYLQGLSKELNVLFCDVWPLLQQLPEDEAYLDEVHLTGNSASLIAQSMFDLITSTECLN